MLPNISERLKQRLSYVVFAALTVPFLASVQRPVHYTLTNISLYLALVTGFMGIVVLMAQFFLGTRSVAGLIYRDMPWTQRRHRMLGTYGTLLIFAHPIFILLPFAQNLLYILKPDFSTGFETSVTWGRIAFLFLIVIWVTSALIRSRIKYRPWKYIHYVAYIILPLALLHSPPIGRTLTNHHALLVYWYGLTAAYLVMLALRIRHLFGFSKSVYDIVTISKITEDSWLMRLRLQPDGGPAVQPHPGQYIYVQRSLVSEDHPFSVVDFDLDKGELLLAFKAGGSFTRKLTRMSVGNSVLVDGPYGTFTEELHLAPNRPRVFIAGGIGITPFVRSIIAAPPSTDQLLFFCNRRVSSSVFRRQLQAKIGARHIDVLSNDSQTTGQNIEHGYISDAVIAKYVLEPGSYDYFICGPKQMMETARTSLLRLGVVPSRIYMEEFSF